MLGWGQVSIGHFLSGAVRFEFALPERKEDGEFSSGCFATRLHHPMMTTVALTAIADFGALLHQSQLSA